MAGAKETFEVELNVDHRIFIRSAVEKYGIGSEDKVIRVIMDFIQIKVHRHPANCLVEFQVDLSSWIVRAWKIDGFCT